MSRSIAIVTPTFPPYRGGIGKVAEMDALQLTALGFDVHVFAPSRDVQGSRSDLRGFAVEPLTTWARVGNGAFVPGAAKLLGEFDAVLLHYPFYGAAEPVWLRKRMRGGAKLILMYHMDVAGSGWLRPVIAAHTRFLAPRIIPAADAILVTSKDYAAASRLAPVLMRRPGIVHELPPSIDVAKFAPGPANMALRARAGIPENAPVVLMVGGLDRPHAFKGVPIMLQALASKGLAEAHLVIVGSGELRPSYEAFAKERGVAARTHFVGGVSEEELPEWHRLADVFAFPSLDRSEAFGIAALEAAASGVPVVATDLPGVRTIVRDSNGLRIAAGSVSSLALAIERLLADAALRRRLGDAGRAMAVAEYADAARQDKWLGITRDVFGTV